MNKRDSYFSPNCKPYWLDCAVPAMTSFVLLLFIAQCVSAEGKFYFCIHALAADSAVFVLAVSGFRFQT